MQVYRQMPQQQQALTKVTLMRLSLMRLSQLQLPVVIIR